MVLDQQRDIGRFELGHHGLELVTHRVHEVVPLLAGGSAVAAEDGGERDADILCVERLGAADQQVHVAVLQAGREHAFPAQGVEANLQRGEFGVGHGLEPALPQLDGLAAEFLGELDETLEAGPVGVVPRRAGALQTEVIGESVRVKAGREFHAIPPGRMVV